MPGAFFRGDDEGQHQCREHECDDAAAGVGPRQRDDRRVGIEPGRLGTGRQPSQADSWAAGTAAMATSVAPAVLVEVAGCTTPPILSSDTLICNHGCSQNLL